VITITGAEDGGTYDLGIFEGPSYEVYDATSGVASSDDSLTGGNSIGLGSFIYSVSAVDYAGNEASVTVSYTVIATTQGTAAVIDQFISSGDISDPGKLYEYLSAAQSYIDSGDNDKAIKNLDQFKHDIDSYRDKDGDKEQFSEAAAVILLGAADAMIAEYSSSGCKADESNESICDDGIDNDCDGQIDFADIDCIICFHYQEICDDGIDNDCDGQIDSADSDCYQDCAWFHPEICDGIDNDCNGIIDENTECYDDDGDGYCEGLDYDLDPITPPICTDGSSIGDCNDNSPAYYPGNGCA
jgi:hypothetical protein